MALKFYIQVKGKVSGPLSGSELMSLAQSGKLLPTDMVRQDGSDNWVQANRIRNLEFGTPQEEPEEEIEEILEVDPDPILPPVRDLLKPHRRWGRAETTPPLGQLSSPIKPAPLLGKPTNLLQNQKIIFHRPLTMVLFKLLQQCTTPWVY